MNMMQRIKKLEQMVDNLTTKVGKVSVQLDYLNKELGVEQTQPKPRSGGEPPVRHGTSRKGVRRWKASDDFVLMKMYKEGRAGNDIARALNRSRSAVHSRAWELRNAGKM